MQYLYKGHFDRGTEGEWFPTWFLRGFGPRRPAAVVSASGSLSSRLSNGKLAMPIMTPALKWSAELTSEWKNLTYLALSENLIYFFFDLFSSRVLLVDALLSHCSNVTFFFHLSSPSSCVFMTRNERAVAEAHTFNLAQIEPQRVTFTSTMGLF